jgi:hypothetical protein
MLTLAQLTAIETGTFAPPWHARDLFKKFPAKSLSLRTIINAVEQQKFGYFVLLRSLSLVQQATSFTALQENLNSGSGKLQASEIQGFLQKVLQPRGITLKLVTSDSRGLIAGTVAALSSLPTVRVNAVNIEDVQTGISNVATGTLELGAILVVVSAAPEPASPVLFVVGVGLGALGAGILFGLGVVQIIEGDPQPTQGSQTTGGTSSSDGTDVPQPDGDSVTVPDAVVFGDLPAGLSADQLAQEIAGDLFNISSGWDLENGTGLPDIPGLGSGDGGDGGLGEGSGGGPVIPGI